MKIRMAQFITTAFILSLAVGLVGIPRAVAGEGSADIGPQPPYGYYPNERGHVSPGYGPMGAGSGRTIRQLRSR
jgi:hypothetical protein